MAFEQVTPDLMLGRACYWCIAPYECALQSAPGITKDGTMDGNPSSYRYVICHSGSAER